MKLTPKQEKFCQEYISTGNKSEAYRRAYNASNMGEATINVTASNMERNSKIAIRLKELRKEIKDKFLYTKEQSILRDLKLIKRYEEASDILSNPNSTPQEVEVAERTIRYIGVAGYSQTQDRLSKQLGFNEVIKIENKVDVNDSRINLKKLSKEALEEIEKQLEDED